MKNIMSMSHDPVSQERLEQMLTLSRLENSFNFNYSLSTWQLIEQDAAYEYKIQVIHNVLDSLDLCTISVINSGGENNAYFHHNNGRMYVGHLYITNGPYKNLSQVKRVLLSLLKSHIELQPENIQALFQMRSKYPGLQWLRKRGDDDIELYLFSTQNHCITASYQGFNDDVQSAIENEYKRNKVRYDLYSLHKDYPELTWTDAEKTPQTFDFRIQIYNSGKMMLFAHVNYTDHTLTAKDENGVQLPVDLQSFKEYLERYLDTQRDIASSAITHRIHRVTTPLVWNALNSLTKVMSNFLF